MEKKEVDTDDSGTGLQQRPTPCFSSVSSVSAPTSSLPTITNNDVNPHAEVSSQNVTFPPGHSFSPITSASTAKTTAKRASKVVANKTKKSRPDDTIFVVTTSLVSPGAVSVPGINSLPSSPNNESEYPPELVDSSLVDRAPSFVVPAQLVVQAHEEEHEQEQDDLEYRIEQEVELRLMKRDPTLVVAKAVPTNQMICSEFFWKWKYLLLSILLCICGAVVAVIISGKSRTPSPNINEQSTPQNESHAKIIDVLRRHPSNLTIDENPTSGTPQSLALNWLLLTNTTVLMQNGSVSDTVILERYGLAVFYYSTSNGDPWTNELRFVTESDVCNWNDRTLGPSLDSPLWFSRWTSASGVFCDGAAKVQQIVLAGNGLNGTIPLELGLLSNLQYVDLQRNTLVNVIPTELGRLTLLRGLGLGGCGLSGTLPTELGNLAVMETLDLSSNSLNGTLPTEFGQLRALTSLDVTYNYLHGTLPAELANKSNLTVLFDHQSNPQELGTNG